MSQPSPEPASVRASDGERERVAGKLEREFAAGRLTTPELEQRIAAAHEARTRAQLRALTLDLPADPVRLETPAAAPDHRLLCLLLCVCPPAGVAYWLACRPRSATIRRPGSGGPPLVDGSRGMADREGAW